MRPNVCSLEDDLHGMNLSLVVEGFDGDRFEIDRNEDDAENVSRRSDVPDIVDGRFNPVFFACGDSIFGFCFFSQ